jgi:acyl-CoA synthetase
VTCVETQAALGYELMPNSVQGHYVAARIDEAKRWGTVSLADIVRNHAQNCPTAPAFVTPSERTDWRWYDETSDELAGMLIAEGVERGSRLGVLLSDGPAVHAVFLAAEKAGLVVVGIGPRAGHQEIQHLLSVTDTAALVTASEHRGSPMPILIDRLHESGLRFRHFILEGQTNALRFLIDGQPAKTLQADAVKDVIEQRKLNTDDVWLLNSTSGTTGMPKCVVHTQGRWHYFHERAAEAGKLDETDSFFGLIPAPYGFGIWTAHVTPTVLGCPTYLLPRFSADAALDLIEREHPTVLCCVSTQFIMMLNSLRTKRRDLTSLRCMFTGGEAVPTQRSKEFEAQTGAKVLQFYGSNETGALSCTRLSDSQDDRLHTCGRVIDDMNVRLYDDGGRDVTVAGGPGQAGCSGPATCLGYYGDPAANQSLIGADGAMLTGDICTIDSRGYMRIVDRKADIIIRGGKNISAAAVEEEVRTHPAVAMAAAVAVPDPTFGERVCVYVTLHGTERIELADLTRHLQARGVTKETWPERLEVLDDLPRASGGKISKADLRRLARQSG